jgi:hypothetical protein
LYYLTEFGSLKKKNSETVMEFIQRFNKLYNKIPAEVKPSQPAAKVTFARAFELDFALLLRERRGATLTRMQDDAVEIESNMMAFRKLKTKVEMVIRNRIQKADRASKRLKNESARNPTKPAPLRPSRFPDSGGIFIFANGVRMEEISRFYRQVKQGKIWVLTVPVRTVRTATWQAVPSC